MTVVETEQNGDAHVQVMVPLNNATKVSSGLLGSDKDTLGADDHVPNPLISGCGWVALS